MLQRSIDPEPTSSGSNKNSKKERESHPIYQKKGKKQQLKMHIQGVFKRWQLWPPSKMKSFYAIVTTFSGITLRQVCVDKNYISFYVCINYFRKSSIKKLEFSAILGIFWTFFYKNDPLDIAQFYYNAHKPQTLLHDTLSLALASSGYFKFKFHNFTENLEK